MISKRMARLIVAALVATAAIGLTADERNIDGQTTKSSVDVVEVTRCDVNFFKRAELAIDRPGIIAEMPFDEGDAIKDGDLVVRLRDEVAQAELALATERAASTTAVVIAEKEAEAAALELQTYEDGNARVAGLHSESVIARSRLIKEAREKAVLRAKEEVSLNQRAKEKAETELESLRIHSKHSGIVTRVMKHEGEAVQQGEGIIEVVDPTTARVEGKLHVSQARKLRIGMPVEVRLDFPNEDLAIEDEIFTGTLGYIDVSATVSQYEVRVWAQVENRDGILLDNLPARMTIRVSN